MHWLRQTIAVTALNIRTIPQRLATSGVAIIGIAGVVVVFVSLLSIAAGFSAAMREAGSPSRALVLRSGADLFPGIHGYETTVVPAIENAILSGHDIIFLGERGQAKTRMARSLINLLDEYIPIVFGSEIMKNVNSSSAPLSRRCSGIVNGSPRYHERPKISAQ